jgi:hypothetical protein
MQPFRWENPAYFAGFFPLLLRIYLLGREKRHPATRLARFVNGRR